jgi:hypothetical protein
MDDRHYSNRTEKNENNIHEKSNDIPDIKKKKINLRKLIFGNDFVRKKKIKKYLKQ